jgi:hypothetical protein
MLREVVTEASLHAGGALVRGVLLDPGRGHPHDLVVLHLQVELAADPAVGTDRADHLVGGAHRVRAETLLGDELEDGAGGTDPDALAAPGAAGVIGIAVAAHDDLGVLPPHAHVEHSHLLDVLAGPDAAGAEDAGAHVVLDHDVAGALVTGAERELMVVAHRDIVLDDVALELVPRVGPAPVGEVLARVPLQQQPEHTLTVVHRCRGLGLDRHPVRRGRGARRHQLALTFDRHQTDPAVPHDGQLGIPAQRGDVDVGGPGGLEDGRAGLEGDGGTVDSQGRHRATG